MALGFYFKWKTLIHSYMKSKPMNNMQFNLNWFRINSLQFPKLIWSTLNGIWIPFNWIQLNSIASQFHSSIDLRMNKKQLGWKSMEKALKIFTWIWYWKQETLKGNEVEKIHLHAFSHRINGRETIYNLEFSQQCKLLQPKGIILKLYAMNETINIKLKKQVRKHNKTCSQTPKKFLVC
jgi:hypothetical protein